LKNIENLQLKIHYLQLFITPGVVAIAFFQIAITPGELAIALGGVAIALG
jgi:hypothetical protein